MSVKRITPLKVYAKILRYSESIVNVIPHKSKKCRQSTNKIRRGRQIQRFFHQLNVHIATILQFFAGLLLF